MSLLVVVSTVQANLRLFCQDSLRRSGEKGVHLWLLDLGVICGLCCGLLGCHWLDYLSVDGDDLLLFAVTLFQIFIILVVGHVKLHQVLVSFEVSFLIEIISVRSIDWEVMCF